MVYTCANFARSHTADKWFKELQQCKKFVKTCKAASKEIGQGYCRVRIAVLDTGLDPAYRHRVKDYMGFTDASKGCEAEDLSGHGTFVVDLLLQVCPSAEVYVARILDEPIPEVTLDPSVAYDTDPDSSVAEVSRTSSLSKWCKQRLLIKNIGY
jgi:hypothetical protein